MPRMDGWMISWEKKGKRRDRKCRGSKDYARRHELQLKIFKSLRSTALRIIFRLVVPNKNHNH